MNKRWDVKCDYCGRFISYADLENDRASIHMVYPDSEYTVETWETYHQACHEMGDIQ